MEWTALWNLIAAIGVACITAVGAYRVARLQSGKTSTPPSVILESKDAKAWQFLISELEGCKLAHRACEERQDQTQVQMAAMDRELSLHRWSLKVLKRACKRAGIMPDLPDDDDNEPEGDRPDGFAPLNPKG